MKALKGVGALGMLTCFGVASVAQAQGLPVTPYKSFHDSPFYGTGLVMYLEDCEDGLINTPGLSIASNTLGAPGGVLPPSLYMDSVDADDGVHGFEPWISGGTKASTRMVKDIRPS